MLISYMCCHCNISDYDDVIMSSTEFSVFISTPFPWNSLAISCSLEGAQTMAVLVLAVNSGARYKGATLLISSSVTLLTFSSIFLEYYLSTPLKNEIRDSCTTSPMDFSFSINSKISELFADSTCKHKCLKIYSI